MWRIRGISLLHQVDGQVLQVIDPVPRQVELHIGRVFLPGIKHDLIDQYSSRYRWGDFSGPYLLLNGRITRTVGPPGQGQDKVCPLSEVLRKRELHHI